MSQEKEENRNTIIDAITAKEPKLQDSKDVLADLTRLTFTAGGEREKRVRTHYTNMRFRRWILANFLAG